MKRADNSRTGAAGTNDATGLPEKFVHRLSEYVPQSHLDAVLASYRRPRSIAFRINPLLAPSNTLEDLTSRGFRPQSVDWLPEAWLLPSEVRDAFLADASVRDGHVYVQNASSMIPVWALDPQPGEKVLDLAAAPGSKTIQIAGRMQGEGELAAVEIVRKRFFRMKALLKKYGAPHVRTFHQDGTRVFRYRPEYFDRVLLDAPCSTEGRFVAGDDSTTRYWSERKINEMAYRQRQLAESAVRCLRPGGVLVYATCTTAPEENESTIDWLLDRFGSALSVEALEIPDEARTPTITSWLGHTFAEAVSKAARILPGQTFESFFVCKLRKNQPSPPEADW
jgi:16S rRNA (cytosine1407-C5)-methyltransferase